MSIALLDTNDCRLQLWGAAATEASPGYALLEGKAYRFGQAARRAARLHPRNINNRFWWQLSTEALQPALGPARHTADLVHAHLLQLHREAGEPPALVLACPGSMQREQLSLLLGIVQQCPFEAVGLVNRSALLGSLYAGRGQTYHLELQLHQAVLCQLVRSGGEVSVTRSAPLPGCGLLQLQEGLVEVIAAAFIRQTRFDPRRKASTEQSLYDALPQALQRLAGDAETNLEINGYRARIGSADLADAGRRLFCAVLETTGELAPSDALLLDPLIALLPGARAALPRSRLVAVDALWQAAREHGDRLVQNEQALNFVSSLPCLAGAEEAPIQPAALAPASPAASPPTHLLAGNTARPLAPGGGLIPGCELSQHRGEWRLQGEARVNGRTATSSEALAPGDQVELPGGETFTLIEVLVDGG